MQYVDPIPDLIWYLVNESHFNWCPTPIPNNDWLCTTVSWLCDYIMECWYLQQYTHCIDSAMMRQQHVKQGKWKYYEIFCAFLNQVSVYMYVIDDTASQSRECFYSRGKCL